MNFLNDDDDYRNTDYDYEVAPRRRLRGCACGDDLPGTCPGRENCPYSGDGDDDE